MNLTMERMYIVTILNKLRKRGNDNEKRKIEKKL